MAKHRADVPVRASRSTYVARHRARLSIVEIFARDEREIFEDVLLASLSA